MHNRAVSRYFNDCTYHSTQPSTLRGTVKWVPAKGRWCSAAGKVTAGLTESNGSLSPGGWLKSLAGWLPVHWDQLRAQRSVTSMGTIGKPVPFLFILFYSSQGRCCAQLVHSLVSHHYRHHHHYHHHHNFVKRVDKTQPNMIKWWVKPGYK